jgi:hypothetical protein
MPINKGRTVIKGGRLTDSVLTFHLIFRSVSLPLFYLLIVLECGLELVLQESSLKI